MKVRWHGMLGSNHSWAFVQQALIRAMSGFNKHDIFLKSTNGLKHFPDDLERFLLPGYHSHSAQPFDPHYLDKNRNLSIVNKINQGGPLEISDTNRPYDLELAYTIFMQSPRRFFKESLVKMIIWNFESSILPPGWHLYHKAIDYFLPSSQFSSDIFIANGVPKEKSIVIPHGVDQDIFNPNIKPFQLKTQKKIKFLHTAIPHHRKLHERVLRGYFDAFTGDDDVCLILKTKFLVPGPSKPFEVDVKKIIEKEIKGRKNPPEIEIIQTYIDNIGSLYTAVDAVVSMSSTEGFCLPLLESMACGASIIAPRHGGQLDFLNDDNSLLVDTKIMKAPRSMQYWHFHPDAVVGDPNIRHFSELLRKFYENAESEKQRTFEARKKTVDKFDWETPAQMIIDLAEEKISSKKTLLPIKKKIMYIIPYSFVGGGEVWIKEIIKKLDKNLYDPIIVCPSGAGESVELFSDLDVHIEDLREQGNGYALKVLIESEKPDIVHFYNSFQVYQIILQTLKDGGWKGHVVETVHSELKWKDSMSKVAVRQGVSMIISVSNTLAKKMVDLGNKNVAVLPQPIDWERFNIEKNKDVLKEFNIPSDAFVVGTVARLSQEKNVQAVIECAKAMPNLWFLVVGDGPQSNSLRTFSSNVPNIIFVGKRNDVEKFYAAFDVLLIPSLIEGLPLVALEAMTVGVPIIAPTIGAIPEIVKTGLNGILVKNSSVNALIAGLNKFFTYNNIDFSNNAKTFVNSIKLAGEKININKLYGMLK